MKINDSVPASLRDAILHSVATHDKRLLNRIELEIVRSLKIQPDDCIACLNGNLACHYEPWEAKTVIETPIGLAVVWRNDAASRCEECEGDGEVVYEGNKRSYWITCPACCGEGSTSSTVEETHCLSDLDGAAVDLPHDWLRERVADLDFLSDPLAAFLRERRQRQMEKEGA